MENTKERQNFIYSKDAWANININEVNYVLSERTKRIIQKLTKQVACPNYKKTPTFKSVTKRKKNQSTPVSYRYSEVSKLENVQHIPQIRSLLNKITGKNLIGITDEIIMKLELIDTNGKNNVVDSIFNIASCNKFYSEQYAYIYVQIEKKYPYIRTLLTNSMSNIVSNILKGKDIEPNDNYDLFCEINKVNDKNRAFIHFIINIIILEKEVELQNSLVVILDLLIKKFKENINVMGCINICNEISELLYISFQRHPKENIYDKTYINSVKNQLENLTNMNRKICCSYTSKAYFKLKDILDILI